MNPTSVALFLPTTRGGGAERNFLRLAQGLHERGYEVSVIVADTRGPNTSWVPDGVALVDLRTWLLPLSLFPLAVHLRRRRPDVVLSALNGANVVALAARMLALTRMPMVVTERNTLSMWRSGARSIRRRWIIPWLVRLLYPRAEAIVGVSQGVADDLAAFVGLDADKVLSIPNPVVDDRLARLADQPLDPTWEARLRGRRVVLNAGRFVPQKDHGMLLEAFAEVHRAQPDTMLVIIGDGPQRRAIERRRDTLGLGDAVLLPGFQDNPYAWMRRADVFALSSRYEGLPTVLIEALACGARVVATDCPSGSAEILEDGRWGTLVPVGDAAAFAAALLEALPRGRWPVPPAAALERFRPDAVLDRFAALIDRLVGEA